MMRFLPAWSSNDYEGLEGSFSLSLRLSFLFGLPFTYSCPYLHLEVWGEQKDFLVLVRKVMNLWLLKHVGWKGE